MPQMDQAALAEIKELDARGEDTHSWPLMARPASFREPAQLAEAPPANRPGQVAVYHSST
jgi:hypothetical protein